MYIVLSFWAKVTPKEEGGHKGRRTQRGSRTWETWIAVRTSYTEGEFRGGGSLYSSEHQSKMYLWLWGEGRGFRSGEFPDLVLAPLGYVMP